MNKRFFLFVILMLFSNYLTGADSRSIARMINLEGMKFYRENKFNDAYESFRKATEADPSYGMAHYNLACTMAVWWEREPCNDKFMPRDVFRELKLAVKYDHSRQARILKDPDLKKYSKFLQYHLLTGRRLENNGDIRFILENVKWNGPRPGVVMQSSIGFMAPNKVIIAHVSSKTEDLTYDHYEGIYSLDGTFIKIELAKPYEGHLKLTGQLKINDVWGVIDFGGEIENFTDDGDWCSA